MHRCILILHFSKRRWFSEAGMVFICELTALEWFGILEKGLPAKADLNFGKSQKSQEVKSGEHGSCCIKRIPFSSRYVCLRRALWEAALSWWFTALSWWIRNRLQAHAGDWMCRRTFGKPEVVEYAAVIVICQAFIHRIEQNGEHCLPRTSIHGAVNSVHSETSQIQMSLDIWERCYTLTKSI